MRKFILIFALCSAISASLFAKKGNDCSANIPSGSYVFYGVDYSLVRFTGVSETPEQLITVLPSINNLMVAEAKKYNVANALGISVVETDVEYVNERAAKIDPNSLVINEEYTVSQEAIKSLIARYPTSNSESANLGLVFIAEQMDKPALRGSFYATFFDLKTKEVLLTCRVEGKPGGFGLRNYWAASVHNVLKNWRR